MSDTPTRNEELSPADEAELDRLQQLVGLRSPPRPPWRRRGLFALFAALVVAISAVYALPRDAVPARIAALYATGPVDELTLRGGTRVLLEVEDPARTDAVAALLRERGATVGFQSPGSLVITLPGLRHDDAEGWVQRMVSVGGFSIQKAVSLPASHLNIEEIAPIPGVTAEVEQWTASNTGQSHSSPYLHGFNRLHLQSVVEELIAGGELVLPPDISVGYGQFHSTDGRIPDSWRTYWLVEERAITREDVERAQAWFGPSTERPVVLIDFTPSGAAAMGALSREHIGRRIAVVVDGEVLSAPIVQSRLSGHSSTISLGGSGRRPDALRAEAEALAAVLDTPPLPSPVERVATEDVPSSLGATALWLSRLTFAFLLAVPAFLLFWLLERRSHSSDPEVAPLRTGKAQRSRKALWIRALVTLTPLPAVWLLGEIAVPGVNPSALAHDVTLSTVGVMPFLIGIVAAELVAVVVGRLRVRRQGDAAQRRPIAVIGLLAGVALAGCAAMVHIMQLAQLDSSYASVVASQPDTYIAFALDNPALALSMMVLAALTLYVLAQLVSRYGLGNGFVAVLGSSAVMIWASPVDRAWRSMGSEELSAAAVALKILVSAIVVAVTAYLLRTRVRTGAGPRRLVFAGMGPALILPAVQSAMLMLTLGGPPDAQPTLLRSEYHRAFFAPQVVSTLLMALLFAVVYLMPRKRRDGARVHQGERTRTATQTATAVASWLGFLALLLAANRLFARQLEGWYLGAAGLAVATAWSLDVVAHWRARWRNPSLVVLRRVHSAADADTATLALAEAGIDVAATGLHLRALLGPLGPFAPVTLLVPQHRRDEAEAVVDGQLGSSAPRKEAATGEAAA